MSVPRTCLSCRIAKAKCDLVRPSCGRCSQRGLVCLGIPADTRFLFRDENEAAQRNSERARRGRAPREGRALAIPLDVMPFQPNMPSPGLQLQYSWLNNFGLAEVPGPLKRDLETRAVDRFFLNWTLYPGNDGVSPGHMQNLHTLYLSSPPESVLWLAVRALAFADMKNSYAGDVPFSIKAGRSYLAALARMREIVNDEHELVDDRVLAALLLIDNFELMYLGRTEPLGPHAVAVKHILHARGNRQFLDRSSFALWRMAHHRLQSRQILLREGPDPDQIAWLGKLNTNQPDIHISADVLQMNTLSAAAKNLTQINEMTPMEKVGQAQQLIHAIQNLLTAAEKWTAELNGVWKPNTIDPQQIVGPREPDDLSNLPIPLFTCPRFLSYNDVWLAYMWNWHAASQIVLRESLVDVIDYSTTLQGKELDMEEIERIQDERDAVDRLSAAIIRSTPMLLGFTHKPSQGRGAAPQGKMAGRFFSFFSLWVVQRANFTSLQHKETASQVIEWINSTHRLD